MDSRTAAWVVLATLMGLLGLGGAYAAGLARRHRGRGMLLALLRALALLCLALLVRAAFFTREPRAREEVEPVRVAILTDGSDSMTLDAGGPTRRQRADQAEAFVRAEAARRGFEVSAYRFGANLVEAGDERRLDRRDTRIVQAVTQVLARRRLDGLVIISDGATSEPVIPPGLREQARRTRTELRAVVPAPTDAPTFDLALAALEVAPLNPRSARVAVRAFGTEAPAPARVALTVSGRAGPRRELRPDPEADTVFRLDGLDPGWHVLAAEVEGAEPEITLRNNVTRAAVQVAPGQRILVVLGEPRIEDRRLVGQIRRLHPDRADIWSRRDPRLAEANPADYAVVVLTEVVPEDLPAPLRESLRDARLAKLLTSGRGLEAWRGEAWRGFPVAAAGAELNLADGAPEGGRLEPARRTLPEPLAIPLAVGVRIDLLPDLRPADGAQVLFEAVSGARRLPAVLADRVDAPSVVVVAPDTTWRWSRHPDPEVRATHAAFWDGILDWLLAGRFEEPELRLEISETPAADGAYAFTVEAGREDDGPPDLAWVRVEWEGGARDVRLARVGEARQGGFTPDPDHPVLWLQARGRRDGRELAGERRPWIPHAHLAEFADPRLRPDRLAELTGDPDHVLSWEGHETALRGFLDGLVREPPTVVQRRRSMARESLLALLFFGLAGVEWLLEKRLREDEGPT